MHFASFAFLRQISKTKSVYSNSLDWNIRREILFWSDWLSNGPWLRPWFSPMFKKTNKTANVLVMISRHVNTRENQRAVWLELKNIRRSRVEMDFIPAVLFESFFIFPNFYNESSIQSVINWNWLIVMLENAINYRSAWRQWFRDVIAIMTLFWWQFYFVD